MSSQTLNFVLSKPNEAADHIDELERRLWLTVEGDKKAADRIEALEAALREIRDLPRVSYAAAAQVMTEIARAALEPEQGK